MSEIVQTFLVDILLPILGTVIAGLATWGVKKLIDFLDKKTKFMDAEEDRHKKDYAKAQLLDAVETAVLKTNQKLVKGLKKGAADGHLSADDAKKAMGEASKTAASLLTQEAKDLVQSVYGKDFNELIEDKIEQVIPMLKASGKLDTPVVPGKPATQG